MELCGFLVDPVTVAAFGLGFVFLDGGGMLPNKKTDLMLV